MLAAAIAAAAGLAVGLVVTLVFSWIAAIIPALVVAVGAYILVVRRVNVQLQQAMKSVQAAIMQKNIEMALTALEGIRARYSRWVPLLSSQLDGQIGSIHFLKKDFDKARPYLERSFARMWEPKLMLAVLSSGQVGGGKGDLAKVDDIMGKATRYAPKQGLVWSTWAYLHWKAGADKRAIEILAKGKDALGEADQVLTQNLLALQNDKKMKMKGYGDLWYQLHLEQHPLLMQAQRGGNVRFARR